MARQPKIEIVQLYDVKNQQLVNAELWNTISDDNIDDWYNLWIPSQIKILNHFFDQGGKYTDILETIHWKWDNKVINMRTDPNQRGFSLVYKGELEAMMIVDVSRKGRMKGQEGKLLVYVDYVQSAPWNTSDSIGSADRYRRCGTIMLKKAIKYSMSLQREGRIGLHSMPSTIDFYERHIGMTALGFDQNYQNLMYFETTMAQSEEILNLGD